MSRRPRIRVGQYGLRTFLVMVVVAGVVAGLAGPLVVDLLRRNPTPLPPTPAAAVPAFDSDNESSAYFESSETPLN